MGNVSYAGKKAWKMQGKQGTLLAATLVYDYFSKLIRKILKKFYIYLCHFRKKCSETAESCS